jgi:hypothetical protein
MTPEDALIELWGRVGASKDAAILVNDEELRQWPDAAVKAMKSQKLIIKARPASSALCPGCERNCVMPVHSLPVKVGASELFVVCDKRSDINRVVIPAARLAQWQSSADLVCRFVATSLGLHPSNRQTRVTGLWEIGIAFGDKRRQMLCLKADVTLAMVAGNNSVPLVELIEYHEGGYSLDGSKIRQLVDSATAADPRYTPSNIRQEARKLNTQTMYESWRKAFRSLRKQHRNKPDTWYSIKIAKMDIAQGRNSETIRKKMKK